MENTPLYAQKVALLSRLVKENALSLEEALLLLKDDEVEQPAPAFTPGTTAPWTTSPYIQPYTGSPFIITSGSSTTSIPVGSNITYTTAAADADLNN